MTKSVQSQNLPADVTHLIDQLERHCLAPDGTYVTKSSSSDLQLAREEMLRERTRYLEAMAVYYEAIAMVEEYQQAVSAENLGGVKDIPDLYRQLGLKCSPQVYDSLEHRLAVAEAAQRLRLPLLSKDGEIHEEEIEKLRMISRSSLDSTSTSITPSSSSNSTSYNNIQMAVAASWEMQDTSEYQSSLVREIESRLEAKCETLADMFTMDDYDFSSISQISSAWLPERLKLIIEEMGRKEAVLLEDLYSMDRKFAEHYNDSVPALYKIRKYLLEATEEASIAYSKAVTRLREYQGVDPHFDTIARQYHDIVKKLEGMQWTIHQVEMDLKRSLDHSST